MASVWAELKRRNVFKVAAAYIIVGWLLLQISDTLVPALHLPEWFHSGVAFLLILGFQIALIFAWAFELTPEGLKKEKDVDRSRSITHVTGRKLDFVIIGLLVVALGYFGYDKFVLDPSREAELVRTTTEAVTQQAAETGKLEIPDKSIAVLSFVNMSDDPGNEYFSDGLSEEILNLLTKIPALKVIARTSSFSFKGKNEDVRIIGDELGVNTVLEGSVRKSGERVRITAQLIDVSDGAQIWSETYNRTMTDIFAVQDDVAAAIIDALEIHVAANPTRGRPTENTEAYALFLKARASLNTFEFRDPAPFLLKAIDLDPNFAEAYELLAYSYWNLAGGEEVKEAAERRKLTGEAAAKALALDPDLVLAKALFAIGNVETYSFLGTIEAFERAVREQPDNPDTLRALSFYLLEAGYLREALTVTERFVELDPLSPIANYYLATALYAVERTSEAIPPMELALQLGNVFSTWYVGAVNLVEKRDDSAIAHFEAFVQHYDYADSSWVRELVTDARDSETGQAYLDRRIPQIVAAMPKEKAAELQLFMLEWYLFFGFLDRYFEVLLEFDLSGPRWVDAEYLIYDGTMFRRLGFTAHPKYLEIAESIGMIDVWEQRGPPDFCEKISGQWVCE